MVEILVVRHGQSEADIMNRCEGRADFALTDLGQQAWLLAEWIHREYTLDAIFSSTLNRAKQTAATIAETTKVPVTYDDDLMEQNNGVIAGMLREEALLKYPCLMEEENGTMRSKAENLKCSSEQEPNNSYPSCLLQFIASLI